MHWLRPRGDSLPAAPIEQLRVFGELGKAVDLKPSQVRNAVLVLVQQNIVRIAPLIGGGGSAAAQKRRSTGGAVRATAQRRERADELLYTLTAYRGSLSRAEGSIEGPRGLKLATSGGLSLKVNDVRNLWGALGEVNIILGRFTVAAVSKLWEAEPDVDGGPLTILNDS